MHLSAKLYGQSIKITSQHFKALFESCLQGKTLLADVKVCVWGGGVYCILYKPCNASSLADLLCGSAPSHPLLSTSGRDADHASFCSLLPWSGYGTRLTSPSGQLTYTIYLLSDKTSLVSLTDLPAPQVSLLTYIPFC